MSFAVYMNKSKALERYFCIIDRIKLAKVFNQTCHIL
jgi:hypothetical protein